VSGSFRITPRAAKDLRGIARHTLKTWGRRQRDRYLRELDQGFRRLADHPELGRPRPDIKAGY
jgi:toxin ParE1/3/4